MTKIIVNTPKEQIIFSSYRELEMTFEQTMGAIYKAEEKGEPLLDKTTGKFYYVDKLYEGENK